MARGIALSTVVATTVVGTAPAQNVVVLGRSRVIGTIAHHLIEAFNPADNPWLSDTVRFDLPSADETVGDMIRISGGVHAEAIDISASVSGLVASCAGGLAMEADSSR